MGEFVEYLKEVFVEFGPIAVRKMFGGYGLFYDGAMFGLVADNMVYLKADDSTASHFESRGLGQFEYDKGDKSVKMSYYLAPDEIYDDPEEAALWAKRSYEVAFRTKKKAPKRQKK